MFTGIIEELGVVTDIHKKGKSLALTIQCKIILEDMHLGDSIAVNGVCLTVTHFNDHSFDADVMPETFAATSLKELQPGSKVNLERAMAANGRFGGHFVSGHVDCTAEIIHKKRVENALYMTMRVPGELSYLLVDRGSIAIDGTSLTIFKVNGDDVTISLIPHTQKETILAEKEIGDLVNIEYDMLVKFTSHLLKNSKKRPSSRITMNMLADNGFI